MTSMHIEYRPMELPNVGVLEVKVPTMVVAADRTWESRMLMFPARMAHCVYPFYTSKDYHISVSGNIVVSQ